MQIKVLFFGAAADIAGKRVEELQVIEGTTAEDLMAEIISRFPPLAAQKLHISIDQEYARADSIVVNGAEIAIFTAVSGG
ncbi:MAG TPA: MoaD/ThiS family protein [Pyrinomonadaceae bacterium]|nr:MoaD/ThiS family protein [Pyrinomonadaceae bacterium]